MGQDIIIIIIIPWGKIKIPGNNYYCKRYRRRFRISYELFYPLVQECKQHHLISSVADSVGTGWTKGLKSTCSSSHFTEGILFRRRCIIRDPRGIGNHHLSIPVPADYYCSGYIAVI